MILRVYAYNPNSLCYHCRDERERTYRIDLDSDLGTDIGGTLVGKSVRVEAITTILHGAIGVEVIGDVS